jgi:antitoxin component YwqK of YwqJK toxin-antitoxin module
MTEQTTDHEMIPESKAARWAWRVSLIPVLGVPLFILLAFLALYRIGSKGRTGFWLLRRGVIAVFSVNLVAYFGLYLSGYSRYYPSVYDCLYSSLPKHGMFTIYLDNKPFETTTWFFGKEEGFSINYFRHNGKIKAEGNVREMTRYGRWTFWYSNGRKNAEGNYVNGKKHGAWKNWSPDGREESVVVYNEPDKGSGKRWEEIDSILVEPGLIFEHYEINGVNEGPAIYRNADGKKEIEMSFNHGKRSGTIRAWHINGRLRLEGTYANDKLIGKGLVWDELGNIAEEETYDDNGKPNKTITYKDGKPVKTTLYKDGKPIEEKK